MQIPEEFSKEKRNLLKLCQVVISVIPTALRKIFKQEWDSHYKMSQGQWLDTAQNAMQFYSSESAENQRKLDSPPLLVIKRGNSSEWDCTCLLFCILDSTSIGLSLTPGVRSCVRIIRNCQNKLCSGEYKDGMADSVFESVVESLVEAFNDLGLETKAIEDKRSHTSFPTIKLIDLDKKLKKERETYKAFERYAVEVQDQSHVQTHLPFFNFQSFIILPPNPNHETIRRINLENKILDELEYLETTKPNEIIVAYISGTPGSGKSQIAREIGQQFFAKKLKSSSKTVFVMTLNAENLDTLLNSYTTFSRRLGCSEHTVSRLLESEDMKTKEKLTCFKNLVIPHICQFPSWLMILDNVTDLISVKEFLPPSSSDEWGSGQLLVTMQDTQLLPMGDSNSCYFSLSKGMKPDVAVDLLSNVSTSSSDTDVQMQVAKLLEFQPLSLACAAIFVRDMNSAAVPSTWKQYLEIIKERKSNATEKAMKSKCTPFYPESMTAAVALLVEQECKKHEALKHVFQYLSLMAPEPLANEQVLKLAEASNGAEREASREHLVTTSPLFSVFDFDSSEIQVHEIVLDVLRREIFPVEDIEEYVSNVTSLISLFARFLDTDSNHNTKRQINVITLRPHLAVLAEHVNVCWSIGRGFAETLWSNRTVIRGLKIIGSTCNVHSLSKSAIKTLEIARLLSQNLGSNIENVEVAQILSLLGNGYRNTSKLKEAKEMHKNALKLYQKANDSTQVTLIAKALNNLGKVHFDLAEYEEAKTCYVRVLDTRKQVLGSFHDHVAESLQNLGIVYYHLAQYESSKQCHREALHIFRTIHHEIADPRISDSLNELGNAHNELAEYELAVKCYMESLSVRRKIYGKGHSKVAQVLDNTGSVYKSLAKYDAAKTCHQEALDIRRQAPEVNYLDVANSLDNLGTVHQAVADFHAAKVCYEQALAIRRTSYPDDHPAVAMSFSNLGVVEEDLADYHAAKTFHQRALEIEKNAHGAEHPSVGRSLYNLGAVYLAIDDYCQAKQCFTESLRIRRKVHGPRHPKVATCLEGLGIVYRELARLEEAQSCLKEALAIKVKIYKHDHPTVATSLDHLGTVHQMAGKNDAAKKLYNEALAIRLNFCDESTPDVAVSFSNLGLVSRALTNYQTAKEYLVKALAINQRVYGTEHPIVADCLGNLGVVHEDLGEHEAAKTCQEESIAIMHKVQCSNHDTVANGLHNLGNIHNQLAEYDAAKKCHKQAMAIRSKIYGQNHPLVADSFFALGIVHHHLSEYNAAMECYKRALAMRQAMYGCDHASVAASFDNLGCLLHELKQSDAAVACHEQSLAIRQELYGEEHACIASSLYNLAADHMSLGDYNKAEQCHLTALEMKQKLYGSNHPTVADSFNNLGIIFMLKGEHLAAKHYHHVALSIREQSNEDVSLEIASSLHNLGLVHQSLREHNLSRYYLERALIIRRKLQGNDHSIVGYTLDSLGLVCQDLGEYDEAKKCHKDALDIRQRIHGHSDPTVADSFFKLGVVHLETSEYKEAKEYFQNVLTVSESCQIDSNVEGLTHHNLGIVYRRLNHIDLSIKHLEQARSILQKSLGSDHQKVVQVSVELKQVRSLTETPKKCEIM